MAGAGGPPPPPPQASKSAKPVVAVAKAVAKAVSAMPQIRDKAAELKRFMPTTLRVKRKGGPSAATKPNKFPRKGLAKNIKANPPVQRPANAKPGAAKTKSAAEALDDFLATI
jgi:hypothetical protein